jgi:hypothetical protein
VTLAVPDTFVSTVEVALTVIVGAASSEPTDRTPDEFIVVFMLVLPVTLHVTPWPGLLAPLTVAEKFCFPPCFTLADDGETVTLLTLGGAVITVTVAVPDTFVSAEEVALTVRAEAVSSKPTVRTPDWVIKVLALALFSTLHTTSWLGLFAPLTDALNVSVPPCCTVAVDGETSTPVIAGGARVTVTTAVPDIFVSASEVALTVRVSAVSS